jgi:cobalt/nickel transport system permease protein
MGNAGRHASLHVPRASFVHRLSPGSKLVGALTFVMAVALTPRPAVGAFALDAAVLAGVVAVARLPLRTVLGRLAVVLPFLSFAALVPLVAGGPQVDVAGVGLSRDGLWAAFGIVAKALLGAGASIVLAATTPLPALITGLGRLRVPAVVVAIVTFMFRYLDLLAEQLARMRRAMTARCHDPRWLWQAAPVAAAAGTLFVRSYERGERVHQAMLARGYTGTMPELGAAEHRPAPTAAGLVPGALAGVAALAATLGALG